MNTLIITVNFTICILDKIICKIHFIIRFHHLYPSHFDKYDGAYPCRRQWAIIP